MCTGCVYSVYLAGKCPENILVQVSSVVVESAEMAKMALMAKNCHHG